MSIVCRDWWDRWYRDPNERLSVVNYLQIYRSMCIPLRIFVCVYASGGMSVFCLYVCVSICVPKFWIYHIACNFEAWKFHEKHKTGFLCLFVRKTTLDIDGSQHNYNIMIIGTTINNNWWYMKHSCFYFYDNSTR